MTDRPTPISPEIARALEALRFKGPQPASATSDWQPIDLSDEDRRRADTRGHALLADARQRFK